MSLRVKTSLKVREIKEDGLNYLVSLKNDYNTIKVKMPATPQGIKDVNIGDTYRVEVYENER